MNVTFHVGPTEASRPTPLNASLGLTSTGALSLRLNGLQVLTITTEGCLRRTTQAAQALTALGLEWGRSARTGRVVLGLAQ